jgi:hypothetical protein
MRLKARTQTALAHAILELADKGQLADVTALLALALSLEREGEDFLSVLVKEASGRITTDVEIFESPFPVRLH